MEAVSCQQTPPAQKRGLQGGESCPSHSSLVGEALEMGLRSHGLLWELREKGAFSGRTWSWAGGREGDDGGGGGPVASGPR